MSDAPHASASSNVHPFHLPEGSEQQGTLPGPPPLSRPASTEDVMQQQQQQQQQPGNLSRTVSVEAAEPSSSDEGQADEADVPPRMPGAALPTQPPNAASELPEDEAAPAEDQDAQMPVAAPAAPRAEVAQVKRRVSAQQRLPEAEAAPSPAVASQVETPRMACHVLSEQAPAGLSDAEAGIVLERANPDVELASPPVQAAVASPTPSSKQAGRAWADSPPASSAGLVQGNLVDKSGREAETLSMAAMQQKQRVEAGRRLAEAVMKRHELQHDQQLLQQAPLQLPGRQEPHDDQHLQQQLPPPHSISSTLDAPAQATGPDDAPHNVRHGYLANAMHAGSDHDASAAGNAGIARASDGLQVHDVWQPPSTHALGHVQELSKAAPPPQQPSAAAGPAMLADSNSKSSPGKQGASSGWQAMQSGEAAPNAGHPRPNEGGVDGSEPNPPASIAKTEKAGNVSGGAGGAVERRPPRPDALGADRPVAAVQQGGLQQHAARPKATEAAALKDRMSGGVAWNNEALDESQPAGASEAGGDRQPAGGRISATEAAGEEQRHRPSNQADLENGHPQSLVEVTPDRQPPEVKADPGDDVAARKGASMGWQPVSHPWDPPRSSSPEHERSCDAERLSGRLHSGNEGFRERRGPPSDWHSPGHPPGRHFQAAPSLRGPSRGPLSGRSWARAPPTDQRGAASGWQVLQVKHPHAPGHEQPSERPPERLADRNPDRYSDRLPERPAERPSGRHAGFGRAEHSIREHRGAGRGWGSPHRPPAATPRGPPASSRELKPQLSPDTGASSPAKAPQDPILADVGGVKHSDPCWYYVDPKGHSQGPCSIVHFHEWLQELSRLPALAQEYQQFQAVGVWRAGMELRVPLVAMLSALMQATSEDTPRTPMVLPSAVQLAH